MQKTITAIDLKNKIQLLEAKQANELFLLKENFYTTFESLKPVNIIKKTLTELTTTPNFKGNIIDTTVSIAAGYLSKKITVGATHNPLKQLLGTLLQIGVTNVVSKNTDGIKSIAARLITTVFKKKNTAV
jgi:hypothetical protein